MEKKRIPKTIPEAQFSLFYGPAVASISRKVWFDDFTEEAIRRPEVLEMCRRIKVVADPEKDAMKVLIPPTDVKIATKDGKSYDMHVAIMPGQPGNQLSWADLVHKLKECAAWSAKPVPSQHIARIREMIEHIETLDDVTQILDY